MVATVLSLKFRVVRHQFAREWWRGLLVVAGGVWSLTLLPFVWWGSQWLRTQPADVRAQVLVGLALVCLVGWIVVPLLVTGIEDTLDPGRFALFGVPAARLMPALTAAAALTVPFLFFSMVFLILSRAWAWSGSAAVAVAAVGGLLTVVLFALTARVAVAWSTRAMATSRARKATASALVTVAVVLGVPAWLTFKDGLESAFTYEVPAVLDWLAYTPIGAGMSAPAALEAQGWMGATARLAIMLAAIAILYAAWREGVARMLVNPRHRGGGMVRRADAILASAVQRASWPARRRADAATRAVRARARLYWRTDPRYLVGAIGVIALPLVFLALVMPVLGLSRAWALAVPVILAASIGWGRHNDVAYDSTALWTDVVAGRIGVAVMRGRQQAVLFWAVPAIAGATVFALAWSGQWWTAPALIGACVGALGVTLGISSVSSVLLPYRAPQPGGNPFGAEVGSVGASMVAQLASSAVTMAALPLVLVPFVLAVAWDARWGWLALVTGVGIGVTVAVLGPRLAGRLYDHRAGRLLALVG